MLARQLSVEQIQRWKVQGRSPGLRTNLFNAEWETLCELACEALKTREELERLRNENELLRLGITP